MVSSNRRLWNVKHKLNIIWNYKSHFGPKLSTSASGFALNLRLSPEEALVFVVLIIVNQGERRREI